MTDEPNIKNDDRLAGGGVIAACPWCKSPETVHSSIGHGERVVCTECHASGPCFLRPGVTAADYHGSVADAINAWNENAALRQRCEQAEADAQSFSAATVHAQGQVRELRVLIDDPVSGWKTLSAAAILRAEKAERERAADRADAERYRWLRGQHWNDSALFVVAGHHSVVQLGTYCPSEEQLDDAIDAALSINAALAHDAQEKK